MKVNQILQNRTTLIVGSVLIILSTFFFYYTYTKKKQTYVISVNGNHYISKTEVKNIVNEYLQKFPENPDNTEIEEIIGLHPRIKSVQVIRKGGNIQVTIEENSKTYLYQNGTALSEANLEDQTIQEEIIEDRLLPSDIPIFYLTAEKDNEILTIKRDIIQIWDQTSIAYDFIWNKISEIEIKKDEKNQPGIYLYTIYGNVVLFIPEKFNKEVLERVWAILYYIEHNEIRRPSLIKIYDDHAIITG